MPTKRRVDSALDEKAPAKKAKVDVGATPDFSDTYKMKWAAKLGKYKTYAYNNGIETQVSAFGGFGKIVAEKGKFMCHRQNKHNPMEICGSLMISKEKNLWNHNHKVHNLESTYAKENTKEECKEFPCKERNCDTVLSTHSSWVTHIRREHKMKGKSKEFA
ncbi:hypothetical protein TruAng_008811 [Truncatella angustata]|nr:hypothetical protein TruAng_008811 [Truncatella angustata]